MNPEPASAPDLGVPPLPPVPDLPVHAVVPASPQTVRWIELILLLSVALGSSVLVNIEIISGVKHGAHEASSQNWLYNTVHEAGALGLCAYILYKQGRSFRQIGLVVRWYDPFYGAAIMLLGGVATTATQWGLYFAGLFSPAARTAHAAVVSQMFEPNAVWGLVAFNVINAFFEELIVRAYLITDLRFLTGSTALAVFGSTVFQGFYHLYQGWQAALAASAGFLVFSLFYIWSRRITAIVIAHLLWDLYVVAYYFVYWRSYHAH